MKPGATYYRGGARIVIDDVPLRVARKPSAHDLAHLRRHEKERAKPFYYNREEKARAIAKQAAADIACYAKALGISDKAAREKIADHWAHILANPMRDESLEYDL